MAEDPFKSETPPSSGSEAEEEIRQLGERSEERMRQLEDREKISEEDVISEQIAEYKKQVNEEITDESLTQAEQEVERLALELEPEEHDEQMNRLLGIMREKGVKTALRVLRKMNNPHLEDDFHRILVAYVKQGYSEGLRPSSQLAKEVNMVLYEVVLPRADKDENTSLKEILSSMEQLYAGLLTIGNTKAGPSYFSLEIALEEVGNQFSFYVAVPRDKQELFIKQLVGIFPYAIVTETKDDFNIFNSEGETVCSWAKLERKSALPLRTYENFDFDPLNSILNGFSKLDQEGEGAAIQLVIKPGGGEKMINRYNDALRKLEKGESVSRALDVAHSTGGEFIKEFKNLFRDSIAGKKENEQTAAQSVDNIAVENVKHKMDAPVVFANLRLVASSRTRREAEDILSDLESSFNQLENSAGGNRLLFKRVRSGSLYPFIQDFTYRRFRTAQSMPLNVREVSTFMHLQTTALEQHSQLKQSYVKTASAPADVSSEGVLLGVNKHRGEEKDIRIAEQDRLRHFYVIGQTGTGKSTLLKNMVVQDIERGEGVCMIDPHGSDLQDVLAAVPPERQEDIVYFDPAYTAKPLALNMLEYDTSQPDQKTFVVNELFSIFQKLYSNSPESMGPMFEQYFRNATMLVIDDPITGNSMLDISRVLSDEKFRKLKLARCKNPVVKQFWEGIASKTSGEAGLQNIVPYITAKFDVFTSNEIVRPIISQEQSSINFRDIMDNRKILLVNLSKGRLGELNSHMLGLILVSKILMAALSRDTAKEQLPPFYLYIDEFQNVTTDSISTILSEARKYKLGLTMAHQFIAQLEDGIKESVFGNVGSMVAFRVGSEDGEQLESQFAPVFTGKDLVNVENRNAYVRLLVNGHPRDPFNIVTLPPASAKLDDPEEVKLKAIEKYGCDREELEERIRRKYQSTEEG